MRPTDLNIDKLKELCAKATVPPWTFGPSDGEIFPEKRGRKPLAKIYRHRNSVDYPIEANGGFIIWARQEVPKLISYVEELEQPIQARIVELEKELAQAKEEAKLLECQLRPLHDYYVVVEAASKQKINTDCSKETLLSEIYRLHQKLELRIELAEEAQKYGGTSYQEHLRRVQELLDRMSPEN